MGIFQFSLSIMATSPPTPLMGMGDGVSQQVVGRVHDEMGEKPDPALDGLSQAMVAS